MKKKKLSTLANTSTIGSADKMTLLTESGLNLATIGILRKTLNGEGHYSGSLDELLATGVYLITTASTNKPTASDGGVVLVLNPRSDTFTRIIQIFALNIVGTRIYIRYRADGGFSPWREVSFL